MYQLYWRAGTASFAPHAMLQELGAPYKIIQVRQTGDRLEDQDYLSVNPAGKVPALKLEDGAVMTEAAAICLYLADHHAAAGLAPTIDDPRRAAYYQWFCHLTNTIQPSWLEYYYPHRHTTATDSASIAAVKEKARQSLAENFARIESHLRANGPYLLGTTFFACDIYLLMVASWSDEAESFRKLHPAIATLTDLAMARPAIAAILAQHDMAA